MINLLQSDSSTEHMYSVQKCTSYYLCEYSNTPTQSQAKHFGNSDRGLLMKTHQRNPDSKGNNHQFSFTTSTASHCFPQPTHFHLYTTFCCSASYHKSMCMKYHQRGDLSCQRHLDTKFLPEPCYPLSTTVLIFHLPFPTSLIPKRSFI